ncbi:ATPase, T2SS/T4P/T4SS family [Pseudomonas sp. FP833]|uniref:ATPase, T2SS/T4P/T4SS family n=1 Tax=Pseudomonas sp. FP833 TaxID=2954102 RepID=UPI0027352C39|nr:ATPase, T2SS/T4P/T4SS family [Pseudomonas sp. FP833]WLI54336.1 ATPase, T2SS/T4P/T4SS family [Pseudomonas sp. FP833]
MYGELRDVESAKAAYSGAMTGHPTWSTLHTNNAIASLQRLIDMEIRQSPGTTRAGRRLINQSLLPVLCPSCRVPLKEHTHLIDDGLLARVKDLQILEQVNLLGEGCSQCRGLGVVDRTVIAETLLTNLQFMDVFSQRGASAARRHWVKEMGGITKISHAIMKIAAGMIDPRHAETIAGPLDFDRQLLELSHA